MRIHHQIFSIHRLRLILIFFLSFCSSLPPPPPPLPPSLALPVWRRSSRKISRFTFQRMLCCKMDSSSPSSPLLLFSTLHPNRPPLYFPTAACKARPRRDTGKSAAWVRLSCFTSTLSCSLHCKWAEHLPSALPFLFFGFIYNTWRILRKWRNQFPGRVDGNQHPHRRWPAGGRVIPSVWVQFVFQQRDGSESRYRRDSPNQTADFLLRLKLQQTEHRTRRTDVFQKVNRRVWVVVILDFTCVKMSKGKIKKIQ